MEALCQWQLLESGVRVRYVDFADADVGLNVVGGQRRGADATEKIWRGGLIGQPKIRNSKTIFDDPMDRMN